jgi:hypothetical protein
MFPVINNEYLRPTLSTGGNSARVGRSQTLSNHPLTFLVQTLQLLCFVKNHDSYKCSLTLTIVFYPNPSPGWSFQRRFHLKVSASSARADFGALSGRLYTHHRCTMSAQKGQPEICNGDRMNPTCFNSWAISNI